jgi:hypothetical protein
MFAVIGAGSLWWSVGLARLHVIGAYRDLDTRGVIDHAELRAHFGDRLADDWWLVATEYLHGNQLSKVERTGYVITALFLVNTAALFAMRFRSRSWLSSNEAARSN